MAAWKFAPALAAGNCVIIKPAEQSSLTAIRVAALADQAGIPAGVFNVVPGFGETAGQAIGLHDGVDMVAFTGSTEVGKLFLQYAGRSNLKQVSLECGGKTPNIVFADAANLDAVARAAADGIFYNSGQVCTAASRLLVQRDMHDEFLERVVGFGRSMTPGNPLDPATTLGTIVDATQTDRILGYIGQGNEEGATAGARRQASERGKRRFLRRADRVHGSRQ